MTGQCIITSLPSFCLSVCLSVRAPTVAVFVRIDEILHRSWGPKSKKAFVGVKIWWPLPYFAPIFTPVVRFQRKGRRSKYRSNNARGPIVAVKSSNDVPRGGYKHKVAKCCNPHFSPKTQKWGLMHFQREYAWLSVWHIISQQRWEIQHWFQLKGTTDRKLHRPIRSPVVTWL